jgi:hypothetical protein
MGTRRVWQMTGGMLTPTIGISVDHGSLYGENSDLKCIPRISEIGIIATASIPWDDFSDPGCGYTRPVPLSVSFPYKETFPGLWEGMPPKMSSAIREIRFLNTSPQTSTYLFCFLFLFPLLLLAF